MKPNIDRNDAAILRALQSDARQTNRAIATAVGLAPSTTLDRIRDLEARRVITGYHASVDLRQLNRPLQAIVAVRLQPKTREIVDRFVERIWAQPETLAVYLVSGPDDVLVHLSVTDTDRLRHLVLESIASFPGVVDERTSLVFEHRHKTVLDVLE
jgi:DNA-binding Lrp family transcriptional regulator